MMMSPLDITRVRTTCPLDCPCACPLSVEIRDGRAASISALEGSDVSPCIKGVRALDRVYHPDRLKYPMLRQGSSWKQISWGDALDILAAKIEETIEKHGLNSIFYYGYNTGTLSFMRYVPDRFLNVLGGVTMTVGSLCENAGLEGLRYTTGLKWSVHQPKDWVNSRYLIIWGKDPSLTWPPFYKYIRQARRRGAKIVVIDPVKNKTAEDADQWIPLRPGTDMALALGMANCIVAESLYDADYVKQATKDFDKLVSFIDAYSVEWSSEITGVKPQIIRQTAREYAATKPASIHAGAGVQHNTWGYDSMRAIVYLVALTGNFGVPGGGLNYYGGSHYFPFNRDALTLESLAKQRVNIPLAKMAEYVRKGKPTKGRMIWVAGGNPVDMAGNSGSMLQAFRSVDFSVVVDQFMSSTAKVASLVLPAAHYLEFDDVIPSWGHTLIQMVNKAMDPPGEARSEYEIFADLARRMGLGQYFSKPFLEIVDEVIAPAGITIANLRERGAIPAPQPLIPFEDGVFPTKSG
ncbi:MAG: molybdopterin-dependent oxidoreductase, partial [Candidatus Binatia bacterium]